MDREIPLRHEEKRYLSTLLQGLGQGVTESPTPFPSAMDAFSPSQPLPVSGDARQIVISKQNPFFQGPDGRLYINLCMDLSLFKIEDISINVSGNKLVVKAVQKEEHTDCQVLNQFSRELQLPTGSDPSRIEASITRTGVLSIVGPLR